METEPTFPEKNFPAMIKRNMVVGLLCLLVLAGIGYFFFTNAKKIGIGGQQESLIQR